ncbi:MAG: TonB-dependent receptor plug domain-containing protein [Bdellovibrionales bacterium]|nr:TonB-dependent receptor plug domain-containing protein [Bdellovibrionales bacterium]
MKQRFPVFIISTVITALSLVAPGLIAKAHSASVLTGKVLEKGTKRPLADVNVFLLPEKLKATSAANGTFEFSVDDKAESEPSGLKRQIVINLTGYQRFERAIDWSSGSSDLGPLYIERIQYSGFETVVVGKTKKRDDQEQILKPEDFLLAPGANRDPVKAIQNLAGVNRANAGTSQIIVQGAEPEDTRYNLDGHTIPLIFHFGGLSSVLYPDSIESVSLLGAGYGPEFSQALGGHVGLRSRKPKNDFWSGQAFIDIFNAGFMAEGPVSPTGSLLISSRYSYIGAVIKKIAEQQESFGFTAAPSFADLSTIYEEKINSTDSLKVTALGSMDQLEAVFKDPINEDPALRGRFSNKTDFFRIITAWNRKLENEDEVSTSIGVGKDSILVDVGDNYFRLDANRLTTRGEYLTHWNREDRNLKSYFGWDNDYTWFEIGIRLPEVSGAGGVGTPISVGPTKEASVKDRTHLTGFYNRNLWKVSDSLTIIPGLRVDSNRTTKEWLLGPRLAFRLMPTSSVTYRLATGVYYQPPSGQQTSDAFGNPSLKSPRALHLNLGWEKDFKENSSTGTTLSVGGFYKSLDRLVVRSSAQVERNGSSVSENFNNDGAGTIYGTEVSWKYSFSEGSVGANYTFSQSTRKQPGQSEFPSAFDQTHNLNLLASYRPETWQRWVFTGRFRYVTGSPLTPVTGGVFDADQDVYVPVRGAFYSERKSSFTQLDVRGEYKWVYDTWILAAYADVQNILNQKNVESVDYSYDYSQREDVMGLGILPTIGVRGEF